MLRRRRLVRVFSGSLGRRLGRRLMGGASLEG